MILLFCKAFTEFTFFPSVSKMRRLLAIQAERLRDFIQLSASVFNRCRRQLAPNTKENSGNFPQKHPTSTHPRLEIYILEILSGLGFFYNMGQFPDRCGRIFSWTDAILDICHFFYTGRTLADLCAVEQVARTLCRAPDIQLWQGYCRSPTY